MTEHEAKPRAQDVPAERAAPTAAAQRPPEGWAARARAYAHMIFVDHGFFRYAYLNMHRVGESAWRSAQPAPGHVRRYARLGIKTVVNLRGNLSQPSQTLEIEACAREGLAYREVRLRSRAAPTVETLEAVAALIDDIEYPAVFHCKAGADRAGLMSALYVMLREGGDVATARRQLSLRFGHVRQGPTGALDAFLDAVEAGERAAREEGRAFDLLTWARSDYDAGAVTAAARGSGFGRFLVDRVLGRE